MLFPKQAYLRFKAGTGHSLKLGRMEFIDGTEIVPRDPTLAALKRDRIAHRLLGNFGFSDVGRSFDGVQYAYTKSNLNVTLLAALPTRGVFQVDGWGEVNADVFYGAITGEVPGKANAGEWRVFGLGYSDDRDNVLKTDNRPAAIRRADTQHIHIGTFGGHYLQNIQTRAGSLDVLLWGALQAGSWGRLQHRAGAFAAEGGWQMPVAGRLKPWLRGGLDWGPGDRNADDATHGTFFQVLPTPRVYARFPFFNSMNMQDVFAAVVLRPAKSFTVRSDPFAGTRPSRGPMV